MRRPLPRRLLRATRRPGLPATRRPGSRRWLPRSSLWRPLSLPQRQCRPLSLAPIGDVDAAAEDSDDDKPLAMVPVTPKPSKDWSFGPSTTPGLSEAESAAKDRAVAMLDAIARRDGAREKAAASGGEKRRRITGKTVDVGGGAAGRGGRAAGRGGGGRGRGR